MIVERISCQPPPGQGEGWPFDLPAVAQIVKEGLELTAPVTFLVGENDSGKSTVIEAIADLCEISSDGGETGTNYASTVVRTPLGQAMSAGWADGGRRRRRMGFFLDSGTLFSLARGVSEMPGFWDADLARRRHSEAFLNVFGGMFRTPGLYLMDEPETALSFSACLYLTALLHHLGTTGGQVICATHSPLLTALPGAQILELGAGGIREIRWQDLRLVHHWRRYLAEPQAYLHPLLADEA
ncbi:MAG TPA: ABC transporter [Streptosporangiaceae bacterium]|nr:ABC transporter [Streptosporangiaceae bacterium]